MTFEMEWHFVKYVVVLSLMLHTAYANDSAPPCEDTQSWCASNSRFCESVPEVLSLCPVTCGTCKPMACAACEQNCTVLADSTVQCSCIKGYTLGTDNASCVDINECLDFPCDKPENPYCNNYEGHYECTPGKCAPYPGFIDFYSRDGCCKQTRGQCGQNAQNKRGRIVGGKPAIVKFWPWMVHIVMDSNLCGGTLINSEWIVSAAHCFRRITNLATQRVDIRLGVYDTNNLLVSHVRKRKAAQIIMHENFTFPNYDIAVVKMDSPVKFSNYIAPICLPNGHVPTPGTTCFAAGYGQTVQGGVASRYLQQVDLPIVGRDECKKAFSGVQAIDTEKMICAGYKEGGKDACRGDSGGPLMCQRCNNCDWYLAGVTSFGQGCAKPNFYGVYSDVEYFEKWIESKVDGVKIEKGSCSAVEWTNWTQWGGCSKTCGSGEAARTRMCKGGSPGSPGCPGASSETRPCNTAVCVEEGKWSQWSACSATCGGGERTRERDCEARRCSTTKQIRKCNTDACPTWSSWSSWSDCSETCGGGIQTATRTCSGRSSTDCPGLGAKARPCGTKACDVPFGPWTNWSPCSASCGGGQRIRTRDCSVPSGQCIADEFGLKTTDTGDCSTQDCVGTWAEWSPWAECSHTCGAGTQSRSRTCQGGSKCPGSTTSTRSCNLAQCAEWTQWSEYGACSVACGGGTRERTRSCMRGGFIANSCVGKSSENEDCNTGTCQVACSLECMNGVAYGYCINPQSKLWMDRVCPGCCNAGCQDVYLDCALVTGYCLDIAHYRNCLRSCGYCSL